MGWCASRRWIIWLVASQLRAPRPSLPARAPRIPFRAGRMFINAPRRAPTRADAAATRESAAARIAIDSRASSALAQSPFRMVHPAPMPDASAALAWLPLLAASLLLLLVPPLLLLLLSQRLGPPQPPHLTYRPGMLKVGPTSSARSQAAEAAAEHVLIPRSTCCAWTWSPCWSWRCTSGRWCGWAPGRCAWWWCRARTTCGRWAGPAAAAAACSLEGASTSGDPWLLPARSLAPRCWQASTTGLPPSGRPPPASCWTWSRSRTSQGTRTGAPLAGSWQHPARRPPRCCWVVGGARCGRLAPPAPAGGCGACSCRPSAPRGCASWCLAWWAWRRSTATAGPPAAAPWTSPWR